jgi:PadR family transcriptional regulator, regulatory protein PadR
MALSRLFLSISKETPLPSPCAPMPVPVQADARGSLDLLVLKILSLAPMHGWGIGQRIEQITVGDLEVSQGSLYPALQRLEHRGLITSEWGTTDSNRRARFYTITRQGLRALGEETESWLRFVAAMGAILLAT